MNIISLPERRGEVPVVVQKDPPELDANDIASVQVAFDFLPKLLSDVAPSLKKQIFAIGAERVKNYGPIDALRRMLAAISRKDMELGSVRMDGNESFKDFNLESFSTRTSDVAPQPLTLRIVEYIARDPETETVLHPRQAYLLLFSKPGKPERAFRVVEIEYADTEGSSGNKEIIARDLLVTKQTVEETLINYPYGEFPWYLFEDDELAEMGDERLTRTISTFKIDHIEPPSFDGTDLDTPPAPLVMLRRAA